MREIDRQKIALARQTAIDLGPYRITIRRPSPWEIASAQAAGKPTDLVWAAGFAVGWNLKESDLFPGGDPEPVAFDAGAFSDWLQDRPEHWKAYVDGVAESYRAHEAALAERGNA